MGNLKNHEGRHIGISPTGKIVPVDWESGMKVIGIIKDGEVYCSEMIRIDIDTTEFRIIKKERIITK